MSTPHVLLIGAGYTGLPLARAWQSQGYFVSVWVHTPASAESLAQENFQQVIIGSVGDDSLWKALPEKYGLILHTASSSRGGEEAYQEVFLRGVRCINHHQPQARRLVVSSSSVYAQSDGEWVTEESLVEPGTPTGKILRQMETEALAQGVIIARSAGIYGPERSLLFTRLQKGEAILEGDGLRWMNQIHRDDLVRALLHLSACGQPGEIYNVCDDEPVSHLDYYRWCADFLHCPLPPSGPLPRERKRGWSNKRVANAKLRATGWEPLYPSFREGLTADHSPR